MHQLQPSTVAGSTATRKAQSLAPHPQKRAAAGLAPAAQAVALKPERPLLKAEGGRTEAGSGEGSEQQALDVPQIVDDVVVDDEGDEGQDDEQRGGEAKAGAGAGAGEGEGESDEGGGESPGAAAEIINKVQEGPAPASGAVSIKAQGVAPAGAPGLGNADNTCRPALCTLAWEVVAKGSKKWKVNVQSLTLHGNVNIKPWPSAPNSMTAPNTANPVDGGNINNTVGSPNRWTQAVDDMEGYHKAGGGAGPYWHMTEASTAHEWEHWNVDWIKDSVKSGRGGSWGSVNRKLDKLTVKQSDYATKALAEAALRVKVDTIFGAFNGKTVTRWNAIPDTPGLAGSRGYVAGQKKLNGLIKRVKAYAKSNKWKR